MSHSRISRIIHDMCLYAAMHPQKGLRKTPGKLVERLPADDREALKEMTAADIDQVPNWLRAHLPRK